MAKYIAFTIFDTSDKTCEVTGAVEYNEELDKLSSDEIKSALAFGLAAKVTGLMDLVVDMVDKAKQELMGEVEPDKEPDKQPDDEYKIVG